MGLAPQQLVNGKYLIVREIGFGGMGRVWLAQEPAFNNALRAIKEPISDMADATIRFDREVKLAAAWDRIRAPNIVRAYSAESFNGGKLLVLEYMAGGSLETLLENNVEGLSVDRAVRIALDILMALAVVHAHPWEVVHRDIKPSNILFDEAGTAHLADFGAAQVAEWTRDRSVSSSEYHPPTAYMSPEQATSGAMLTPASDLYSLGAVLYKMLCGQSYKRANGLTAIAQRSDIPHWLVEVLTKALASDAGDRWQTAEEFAAALESKGKAVPTTLAPVPIPYSPAGSTPGVPPRNGSTKPPSSSPSPSHRDIMVWEILGEIAAVVIALIAFVKPELVPQGLPDVLTSIIGLVAAIAALLIPGRRLVIAGKAAQEGDPTGARANFEVVAVVAIVAIVAMVVVFIAYLVFSDGRSGLPTTPIPTAQAPTSTPMLPASAFTSIPAISPTPSASVADTPTASPSPSQTPSLTSTPTSTSTPTPTAIPSATPTPPPTETATSTTSPNPNPEPNPVPVPRPKTSTPTSIPPTYPAVQLVAPANNAVFAAGDPGQKTVTLQWSPLILAVGDQYLLKVAHRNGVSWVVTDGTQWSADWLSAVSPVDWWVAVCRGAPIGETGAQPACTALSGQSETRRFEWASAGGGSPPRTVTAPE